MLSPTTNYLFLALVTDEAGQIMPIVNCKCFNYFVYASSIYVRVDAIINDLMMMIEVDKHSIVEIIVADHNQRSDQSDC